MEMWSEERKRGSGQTLVAGSVVQGAELRVWVKPRPARVWSEERNYGLGSSTGGGKCGPWGETAGLGQTLVAGNVVRGEKLRLWVKRWWREVWSREKNYGLGSNLGGGKCGPWEQNRALGQTLPRPSVVQGEKLRPRVKPAPAEVWSVGAKPCPGSSAAPAECGPGSKTAAPGQALPRPSVVRGSKTVPWVKLCPARVWSRERNCGPGSNPPPPKCGPGSKTAAPGQTLPRPSVVQGAKPCPRVTPGPVTPSSHLKYKKESKTNI